MTFGKLSVAGLNCCVVRPPCSACHLERAFSLLGHILTHDCLNLSRDTLRHLAVMYVNKMDKKRNCENCENCEKHVHP